MDDKKKIVVICGPTATGKTGLAISLANRFDGEIISADSMQIYKNLSVGTAKATEDERRQAVHHLVDILDPRQDYSVSDFVNAGADCINDITGRGKLPVIAGGTGLYIESLINGVNFAFQEDNTEIRRRLHSELEMYGAEHMYNMLCEIDPEYAAKIHKNNTIRVLRALEVYRLTGNTMTDRQKMALPEEKPYDSFIIGLTCSEREILYEKINMRVDIMLSEGILAEAEYVYKNKDIFKTAAAAIGYKEFFPFFEGTQSLDECVNKLKQASRNYAKRQLTWFRRMKDISWFNIDEPGYKDRIVDKVKGFLG